MKVITFSRKFPTYHPKAGQSTGFIEKILVSITEPLRCSQSMGFNPEDYEPKHHTVRANDRFKVGEMFSPRVWSGIPYKSKQIEFSEPIKVAKVFKVSTDGALWWIDNKPVNSHTIKEVAKNDGLTYEDFLDWFKMKPFLGQIICWNENINY